MNIPDILSADGIHFSFEFFPPKDSGSAPALYNTVARLKDLKPDFCSVTWGAGGSSIRNSLEIVDHLQNVMSIPTVAHFTGLGMTHDTVDHMLKEFADRQIYNLLVLRGDKPHARDEGSIGGFKYASELVSYIRQSEPLIQKQFSIFVAGHPEGHPEAKSFDSYMHHLTEKIRLGADGVVTQFFFDNRDFYTFQDVLRSRGVNVPISVGVMIITKASMIQRMVELSGCSIPEGVAKAIELYEDDDESMMQWGIDFAVRQIKDLTASGVNCFHMYTLNRDYPVRQVMKGLKQI